MGKLTCVCISDTHGHHRVFDERDGGLPFGDVLIHAGDATMSGSLEQMAAFANWFVAQPHEYKLFVPGNHDFCMQQAGEADTAMGMFDAKGVRVLIDRGVEIAGLAFWGSPWVPNLRGWAFYADSQQLRAKFALIPYDTNVLVTHGPPAKILDLIPGAFAVGYLHGDQWMGEPGLHVGSLALLDKVRSMHQHLKLHVFGHVHESAGVEVDRIGTQFVNAASCNGDYQCVNPPVVVEVDNNVK